MNNLEQTIIREMSTLPETRLPDVLAFIRFLKISIPRERKEIEEDFDKAPEIHPRPLRRIEHRRRRHRSRDPRRARW